MKQLKALIVPIAFLIILSACGGGGMSPSQPKVTESRLPSTSNSLNVPFSSFNSDGLGFSITGYFISESSTTPSSDASGQTHLPGVRHFMLGVKDVGGIVSSSKSATVTITL